MRKGGYIQVPRSNGRGFVKIWRSVFDHEMFTTTEVVNKEPMSRDMAWLWLVAKAAWQHEEVKPGQAKVSITRGEAAISVRSMAKELAWSYKRTRLFLEFLKAENMVQIRGATTGATRGAGYTVITICNYETYQPEKTKKGATRGATRGAVYKEGKEREEKKEKILRLVAPQPDERFEELWEAFPHRTGDNPKKKAREKFVELTKSGVDPGLLIEAAGRHIGHDKRGDDRKFIPMLITWLNQHRWEDGILTRQEPVRSEEERNEAFAKLRSRA